MRFNLRIGFLLTLVLAGTVQAQNFSDLKGNWKTAWDYDGTNTLRLYLRIAKSGTNYTGALDDLYEGYNNIAANSISTNQTSVRFDFSNVGYVFDGLLNSNFTQITGTWALTNGAASWPLVYDREPSVDELQARTFTNSSGTLPYRLFVPADYDPAKQYPLILHLHGSGERGIDNRIQISSQSGPLAFLFHENQAKQSCFLVAPQCPTTGNWIDNIRRPQLVALIAALKQEFKIDADRVFVTGLSMGGIGTWELLAQNGNLFAAGVPMSGAPGTLTPAATAALMFRIPVWNFHAFDDSVVPVGNSQNLIGAMRALGGTPIYTEFATGDHPIWSSAYATPRWYDWMMAQHRGTPTNVSPFVTITTPTTASAYVTPSNTVTLQGVAGDTNARVSSITWANNRGGSGTATGTDDWSVPSVTLQTGTNIITVTATGTSWVKYYGGTTTFSDVLTVRPPQLYRTVRPTSSRQPKAQIKSVSPGPTLRQMKRFLKSNKRLAVRRISRKSQLSARTSRTSSGQTLHRGPATSSEFAPTTPLVTQIIPTLPKPRPRTARLDSIRLLIRRSMSHKRSRWR